MPTTWNRSPEEFHKIYIANTDAFYRVGSFALADELDKFVTRCALELWSRAGSISQHHVDMANQIYSKNRPEPKWLLWTLTSSVCGSDMFMPPVFFWDLAERDAKRGTEASRTFIRMLTNILLYLAAADDTYSSGKMAESGLAFTAKFNTFKFVANWAGDSQADNLDKLGLNFGADFVIPDTVKIGTTLKNITSDDRTFGIFAGLGSVENLVLNAGYIYISNDIFPAKHALQASAAYTFKDAGINVAADVVSVLTNEFVKDGETEEYKNSDGDKVYPFYTRVAASYSATENLKVKGDVKLSTLFGEDYSTETVV